MQPLHIVCEENSKDSTIAFIGLYNNFECRADKSLAKVLAESVPIGGKGEAAVKGTGKSTPWSYEASILSNICMAITEQYKWYRWQTFTSGLLVSEVLPLLPQSS